MTASVREQTGEIAGVQVRWVSVIVLGHTVEQMLCYDFAVAEAVHAVPSMTRWTGRSRWPCSRRIASRPKARGTRSCPPRATCSTASAVRTAKIEHYSEIEPQSAGWVITHADGTEVEPEPWGCVPICLR